MNDSSQPETKAASNSKMRKKGLIYASLFFLLLFIIAFFYWLFVARYEVSTDDAYVSGIQAPIVAQTSGNVIEVFFTNTDYVKKGDLLVRLDPTNAKLALQQAKDNLANTVRETQKLYIQSAILSEAIQSAQITLNQSTRDYNRRLALSKERNISVEDLQHAKEAVELDQLTLNTAQNNYKANQAQIHNVTLENQPAVKQASDAVRSAWIALKRTEIRSPINGYVAQSNVQVGAEVSPTASLMSIVPEDPMWVDANFKETQLSEIRVGQSVSMESDIYGDDITYEGKVVGINMGTGSAFSLLPAQNATGNWIKVVQRLPVRIELNPEQLKKYPLRIGLSMNVTVDIRNQDGSFLPQNTREQPFYTSDALVLSLSEVDDLIQNIIQTNQLNLE